MYTTIEKTIELRNSKGALCGTYHYQDPFKSFFRGLYTPKGLDVVAPPLPDHPHHKGLQFGLCLSDVNFWEEDTTSEPPSRKIAIGKQQTTKLELLRPTDGNGFSQEVLWRKDEVISFVEQRNISIAEVPGANVWTWRTTLSAARDVEIIKSVWPGPGYCGLGLRLTHDLFETAVVLPPLTTSGSIPTSVTYQGKEAEVTFQQDANQANALFVSFYNAEPYFAFMSLGPTNLAPRSLKKGERLEGKYVIRVADI